ncbi:nmrA-like family protein [Sarocladium implicatum]|nr:nmrA-like family protein [Sarocladium implicatum]
MSVVVVAGGRGDFGRLITDALLATEKHEVYVTTRKAPDDDYESLERLSPLSGKPYNPVILTDYSSEDSLISQLAERKVQVVICTFIMDSDAVADSQARLIAAADKCPSVTRFIPSEWNVEYDVADDVLPYPEKKYHTAARRVLEKTTTLEYAYIYPGMFMDYFGMPRVASTLRPLCFFVDPAKGQAVLPGDGEAKMSMTFTTDAARYTALALDLDKWPRIMTTEVSTVTLNELVRLIEKSRGKKMQVQYQPVEAVVKHEVIDLPTNLEIAGDYPERFPEMGQLRALIADLEAGVALGAYDFDRMGPHFNLAEEFEGKIAAAPWTIEKLVEAAWRPEEKK